MTEKNTPRAGGNRRRARTESKLAEPSTDVLTVKPGAAEGNLSGLDKALAIVEAALLESDTHTAASKLAGLSTAKIRQLITDNPDLRVPLAELRGKWLKDVERIATMNHDGDLLFKLVTRLDKAEEEKKEKQADLQVNVQVNAFLAKFQEDARKLATEGLTQAASAEALDRARRSER